MEREHELARREELLAVREAAVGLSQAPTQRSHASCHGTARSWRTAKSGQGTARSGQGTARTGQSTARSGLGTARSGQLMLTPHHASRPPTSQERYEARFKMTKPLAKPISGNMHAQLGGGNKNDDPKQAGRSGGFDNHRSIQTPKGHLPGQFPACCVDLQGSAQLALNVKSLKYEQSRKPIENEIAQKSAFKETLGLGWEIGESFPRRPTTCTGFHSGHGYRSSQPEEPSYKINPTNMARLYLPGCSSVGSYSTHDLLLPRPNHWHGKGIPRPSYRAPSPSARRASSSMQEAGATWPNHTYLSNPPHEPIMMNPFV
jgi:hypothetical protein